jgi:hypothetical protein
MCEEAFMRGGVALLVVILFFACDAKKETAAVPSRTDDIAAIVSAPSVEVTSEGGSWPLNSKGGAFLKFRVSNQSHRSVFLSFVKLWQPQVHLEGLVAKEWRDATQGEGISDQVGVGSENVPVTYEELGADKSVAFCVAIERRRFEEYESLRLRLHCSEYKNFAREFVVYSEPFKWRYK